MLVEIAVDLPVLEGVVPERDHVDAGTEEFFGVRGFDPHAGGGVLAVGDHRIRAVEIAKCGQLCSQQLSPRLAHHISEE